MHGVNINSEDVRPAPCAVCREPGSEHAIVQRLVRSGGQARLGLQHTLAIHTLLAAVLRAHHVSPIKWFDHVVFYLHLFELVCELV